MMIYLVLAYMCSYSASHNVAQNINQYFSVDLLLQYRLTKLQSNHRKRSRGTGGTCPPNDGVGGTMHSGPPNSDTSGP